MAPGRRSQRNQALSPYLIANATIRWTGGGWKLAGIVDNVFGTTVPIFGTFNENRRTGQLERFLTPATAREFRLVVGRTIGRLARDRGVTPP